MNFNLWLQALKTVISIPTKKEWDLTDPIAKFLIASRASVIIMTLFGGIYAGILALKTQQFNLLIFILVIIGLVAAHLSNNLINDFIDYKKQVDAGNYFRTKYGTHPLGSGYLSQGQFLFYIAIPSIIGILAGLAILQLVNYAEPAVWLFVLGIIFVLFYTWPLKWLALGEVVVFIVWGPMMIAGSYFVITGEYNSHVLLESIPYGLVVTNVIFGKHIDKINDDKKAHIRTLPVLLGEEVSRYLSILFVIVSYLIIGYLMIVGFYSPALILTLLALPKAFILIKQNLKPRPINANSIKDEQLKKAWPLYFVRNAFFFTRSFGFWYFISLIN